MLRQPRMSLFLLASIIILPVVALSSKPLDYSISEPLPLAKVQPTADGKISAEASAARRASFLSTHG